MERLTKYVNGVVWYNYKGNKYPAYDMDNSDMLHALDRLAQLEDEAEQREKGCEFCNNKQRKASPFEDASLELHRNRLVIWEDLNNLGSYIVSYCPVCGKRLVE